MGHGTRQMCRTDAHGFPKRHRARQKRYFGMQTGDLVKASVPQGKYVGTWISRVVVKASGWFDVVIHGKKASVHQKYCTRLWSADGYTYTLPAGAGTAVSSRSSEGSPQRNLRRAMRDETAVPAVWAAFTAKTLCLEAAVLLLALAVVVLAGVIGWYVVRGVPVHYIPPGGPGLSQPGNIPDAVALDFAGRWLARRYTFVPATLKGISRRWPPPCTRSSGCRSRRQLEREAPWITEHNVSCQLGIVEARVLRRTGTQVTVSLGAVRRLWVGKQALHDTDVQAELTLHPTLPTALNPAGLLVVQVATRPALTPPGS